MKRTGLMNDISRLLTSGQLSPFFKDFDGGPYVQRLEREFARYVGAKYAVSVANGTLALNAAYTATQLPLGTEFITTPWTFVATVSEIVRAGHTPVFGDVDPDTGTLDPESVASKISPKTGCIVPMHALGVPCEMDKILELKKMHINLHVCEDSCQGLGSTFSGKMCGSFGDTACFSLQQTKSLSSGEGGVVVTSSEELYDRLRHLRNHGNKYGPFRERFTDIIGTNYRLTEIQAAIALHALKGYPAIVRKQLERLRIMSEGLAASELLQLQAQHRDSTRNGYIIGSRIQSRISDPERVRQKLLKKIARFNKGIPGCVIGPGYSELVCDLPAFRRFKSAEHPCPQAEELVRRSVWFDIRKMPKETVKELTRQIEKFKV